MANKKETKAEKFANYAEVVKAIREGKPVKRIRKRNKPIPTHPVVPVMGGVPEKYIVAKCISWLRKKRLVCDRMNVGAGHMGTSGFHVYGIKGAGDIIGLLPNGKHFEIECKRSNGGYLSYEQQKRKVKIRKSNGLYFVVHGTAELACFLEPYL